MVDIDLVRLDFNPQTLFLLNCVLGFVVFGAALELKAEDFTAALATPRALVIGLVGHSTVWSRRPPVQPSMAMAGRSLPAGKE